VLAWILLRLLGRQNSGTRFAIWFSALAMIGALPFVTVHRTLTGAALHPELSIPSSWAGYIFAVWALIALLAVLRVVHGLWRVRKLRANCVPLEESRLRSFVNESFTTKDTKVHKGKNVRRDVRVCVSEQVKVPTAIGFFRPMVVVPRWALEELSWEELKAVLLHEMAHLRRWDDWSNLAQKIIRALLFFHPAVWWIDNRLTLEREMACDELVLDQTANPRAYAECLVSLAEKNFLRRGLVMAQAAVGRIKHMSLRIGRILDAQRPGATRTWKPAMALLALFSAAGVTVLTRTAPLVGFQDDLPRPSATVAATDQIHVPAHMVVPAGLHRSSMPATLARHRQPNTVNATARPKPFNSNPAVIAARAKNVQQHSMVVQAKAKQPATTGQPMFVVVQTEYFASPHEVVWTMTVWRIDHTGPAQKQIVADVDPRSI
jgi:beta-lactamase regulating signal transducer with metallopeptidase domain